MEISETIDGWRLVRRAWRRAEAGGGRARIPGVFREVVRDISDFCCCFRYMFSLQIFHILDFCVIPLIILQGTFYVLIRQRQSENVFKRVVGSQHLSFDTIMTSGDSTNHYESPRATCGHCEWRQAVWFFSVPVGTLTGSRSWISVSCPLRYSNLPNFNYRES